MRTCFLTQAISKKKKTNIKSRLGGCGGGSAPATANTSHLIVTTCAWRHVSLASSADDDDDDVNSATSDVSLWSDDSSLEIGVVSNMYM